MIIAWFYCGVTSAVACKIALSLYDDVHIYYIETGSGHRTEQNFFRYIRLTGDDTARSILGDMFFRK